MSTVPGRTFTAGSLIYTRAGLITLFFWLIWGDFVFNFMESVLPTLLPLLLKANGATNEQMIIIVSTLYMVINASLNPFISSYSDRFRSRWGRRRPFIVVTTPFVVFFLAVIPFAPGILHRLNASIFIAKLLAMSPVPPLMLVFALLVIGFRIFNMGVTTTYYYLVPDVVPQEYLGRFFALFRLVGALAGMTYNYFVYGLSQTHMKMIFVTSALVYGFFILLMCWHVKEGEYPPPLKEAHGHWWSGIQNYVSECFGYSYYWWVFLTYSAFIWAGIGSAFSVFFLRDELGLSLAVIGKLSAWGSLLFIIVAYPLGSLIDRWGCQKSLILGSSIVTGLTILGFCIVSKENIFALTILGCVPSALVSLSIVKWTAEVYPRDRYGQFSSAGALFSSIGGIILGPLGGWWMDWVKHYRYFMFWNAFFFALGTVAASVVYRKWKALGGPNNYQAP